MDNKGLYGNWAHLVFLHKNCLIEMKITVPEGKKAQIVHAICKFINFNDEGIIENGAVLNRREYIINRNTLLLMEIRQLLVLREL